MAGRKKINRFDVHWVELDPTRGAEMRKTRPAVVISPDVLNHTLHTVVVAPLTSKAKGYLFRTPVAFKGVQGEVALDHMRSIDKKRCVKKLGSLSPADSENLIETLSDFFAK